MFVITKTYDFAYAHRVWAQNLDPAKSCNSKPKCRHVHGHEAKVTVTLAADKLQSHDVVLDYNEFKFFKKFLDDILDHKLILDINDPLLLQMGIDRNLFTLSSEHSFLMPDSARACGEYLEGVVLMDGIPTSENIAKKLAIYFNKQLPGMLRSVEFKESDSSSASYIFGENE